MVWAVFAFAIPWTGFAIFWTVGAATMLLFGRHGTGFTLIGMFFPLFGLPFIGVGVWLLTSPWRAKKRLAEMAARTGYVITDRRAIIFDAGMASLGPAAAMMAIAPRLPGMGTDSLRIESFPPDKLRQLSRVIHADGTGDIIIAEKMVPVYHEHHRGMAAQSIGFKGITQVQEVERMLKELAEGAADEPPVLKH
jgi:hypothetical protein